MSPTDPQKTPGPDEQTIPEDTDTAPGEGEQTLLNPPPLDPDAAETTPGSTDIPPDDNIGLAPAPPHVDSTDQQLDSTVPEQPVPPAGGPSRSPDDATIPDRPAETPAPPTGDDQTIPDRPAAAAGDDKTIPDQPAPTAADDKTMPDQPAPTAADDKTMPDQPAPAAADDKTMPDQPAADDPDGATMMGAPPADDIEHTMASIAADAEVAPEAAMRKLDRFELLKVLGQGAFGTVYLARDPKLDRQVAVKVARTGVLVSRRDIDRFLREARSAAQLRHPNIVPVYEVGQMQSTTYIVHEFIEGSTLKNLLHEKGRLAPREAADLMSRIARALDYAHAQGIIHRDMKPDNVLIDKAGEPHIADFGLARRDDHDAVRTREGTLMGTPAYMSPEQAAGKLSEVNRRSDVWSLGVMLDEMLTARRPFAGSVMEVLSAVQNQPIKPLRQVDASLPVDLETICMKALERDQTRRFQTGGELADELDRWMRGEPITLRRISAAERLWRWAKRNKTVASLLGAVAISLISGTIFSTSFALSLRREKLERANDLVDSLDEAQAAAIPTILKDLDPLRGNDDVLEDLRKKAAAEEHTNRASRARLALLTLTGQSPERPELLKQLGEDLLYAEPPEFRTLREELKPLASVKAENLSKTDAQWGREYREHLWSQLENSVADADVRLRATCALAEFDPAAERWEGIGDVVASLVVSSNALELQEWVSMINSPVVATAMLPELQKMFVSTGQWERQPATRAIAGLFADRPDLLTELIEDADPQQLSVLITQLNRAANTDRTPIREGLAQARPPEASARDELDKSDQGRANHALVLLSLEDRDGVRQTLSEPGLQGVRTHFADRAAAVGLPHQSLYQTLDLEEDPHVLIATLVALERYGRNQLPQDARRAYQDVLTRLYREHPDCGVHAAVDWLMRSWEGEFATTIAAISKELESSRWPEADDPRRWHHAPGGHLFALFRTPEDFRMGAWHRSADDPGLIERPADTPHIRRVNRPFAIGLREVTIGQFKQSGLKDPALENSDDCPVSKVGWFDAVRYSVWLSKQHNLPDGQECYPTIFDEDITEHYDKAGNLIEEEIDDTDVNLGARVVNKTWYRLPTAAEWEYASRGGSSDLRFFGHSDRLLNAWTYSNSGLRSHPVGQFRPNEYGLFDTLGNVAEWCHTWYLEDYDPSVPANLPLLDGYEDIEGDVREVRGGSYEDPDAQIFESQRSFRTPINVYFNVGFRLARTLEDQSPTDEKAEETPNDDDDSDNAGSDNANPDEQQQVPRANAPP